jgi:hypothetical protein
MNSGDMIELLESLLPFVWFAQANNVPNAAHYAELLDGMICNPAPSSLPQEDDRELVERLQVTAEYYEQFPLDNQACANAMNCRAAADRILQLSSQHPHAARA